MKIITLSMLIISVFGCNNNRTRVISGLEGKALPSFNMLLTDSTTYINTNNIPTGQPIVLFYFSPNCAYCRAQTNEIKNEIQTFKDVRFYFIAGFSLQQIKKYDEQYGLSTYNNITVAQMKDTSFGKYFKIHGVPYLAIYDKEKKLKEVLPGKYNIDVIKNIVFENKTK